MRISDWSSDVCSSDLCQFVMYDDGGDVVARIVEPERNYAFDGAHHRIVAWVSDNPIGQGKYTLSAGLYRDYDPSLPTRGHRYHILSRGYQFRVKSSRRDNRRIVLTPEWAWRPDEPHGIEKTSR